MLGDLGFSSLVLVLTSAFSLVIGLIIRRKWRRAVARQEEIRRLLLLASEETARAELEANSSSSFGYSSAAAPVSVEVSAPPQQQRKQQNYHLSYQNYECIVCHSPTTTRCARCKAVRYCSGKCQILHWRQGHKNECYPPTEGSDNEGTASVLATQQEGYKIADVVLETATKQQDVKSLETASEETKLSKLSVSPEVSQDKEDDINTDSETDSFSGFSLSPTRAELSDDSSTCESKSSTEAERSDGSEPADVNLLKTASGVSDEDCDKPISPKFASLVNSVENFSKLKSNGVKLVSDTATSSPRLTTNIIGGEHTHHIKGSSGFWGRALESVEPKNDDFALLHSTEGNKGGLSGSGSSIQFSFNMSGSSPAPLCVRGSEGKSVTSESDNKVPGHNKSVDTIALSESTSVVAKKARNSSSSDCETQNPMENGSSSGISISKPSDVKSASSLLPDLQSSSSSSYVNPPSSAGGDSDKARAASIGGLPSSTAEKSNSAIDSRDSASHQSKTKKPGCLLSSSSVDEVHSISTVKSRKANIPQEIASCPPNGRIGSKISVWKVVDHLRGSKSSNNLSETGCEVVGRYNDKGLFSYELFVKLYNWHKVELQPCGLVNCGNSCYANAVLQCLTFTPPLTGYFLQGLHSKECARKEWCFTCEFEKLISKAKEQKSPLSPSAIVSQLPNIGSQLGNGKEEDAHEFLRYAIDTMQSVCLAQAGVSASGSVEEETTLMGLTFGGYLRSKIKCLKCQGKSERHERMMDLTVEIEGDIGTLEEALRQFTGTEVLDGDNKYQCSRCKSYERAKKKLTILEAPNVLTIALKRFQSGKFGKLNKPIRFPEILNLAPYVSGSSDKLPVYKLYGVIVHLDIMNAAFSGHYVCYVKNMQNKWFKVDDSTVTPVDLDKVLTKGAYMLLYARCSPRAPRLIRNRIIPPDQKSKVTPIRINGKSAGLLPRSANINYCSSDGLANIETFYTKFERLQRILEEDSSDSSSLLSSTSDEGSWTTDSTRDSTSNDELSDYIFCDSYNSPWRNSSDSDTSSSSSSPSFPRQTPLADSQASGFPETSGRHPDFTNSATEDEGFWDRLSGGSCTRVGLDDERSDPFLHSDMNKQCRKVVNSSSSSSSSSSSETDSSRLGWFNPFNDVKSGLTFRKSSRERTD